MRSVDELCSPDEAMTWQTRGIAASTKQLGNAFCRPTLLDVQFLRGTSKICPDLTAAV
ncbi:hypothetical protein ABIE58_003869 [Roseovarius sp. MBR-78]